MGNVPLAGVAALLLVAWGLRAAPAHDRFGNLNWIANGHFVSPIDGSHCCGIADCAVVDQETVTEVAGGLHVRGSVTYPGEGGLLMQAIDEVVPHREIQPSKDGQYWRCKKPDGSRRCFFAPPPGS